MHWAARILVYLTIDGCLVCFYVCVFNQPSCSFCLFEEVKRKTIMGCGTPLFKQKMVLGCWLKEIEVRERWTRSSRFLNRLRECYLLLLLIFWWSRFCCLRCLCFSYKMFYFWGVRSHIEKREVLGRGIRAQFWALVAHFMSDDGEVIVSLGCIPFIWLWLCPT